MTITPVPRVGIIVVTTDKGLCGGLNTNVLRMVLNQYKQWQAEGEEIDVCCIGNKGLGFMQRLGANIVSHAVDKEIGSGVVAANNQLVAVAFAHRRGDTGHVCHDVCDARHRLIAYLFFGDHGDGLRDVAQRCQSFCSSRDRADTVSCDVSDRDGCV